MLSAEIEAAQNRVTNDSFNSHQLRALQQWRDQLRNVSIKTDDIQAASFDEASVQRIKTNSTRLIVLGILLGLVVGVTVAFVGVLIERYKVN
jgi:LPS O-antigen subunit length determinant protein (WzzB/FepE family)